MIRCTLLVLAGVLGAVAVCRKREPSPPAAERPISYALHPDDHHEIRIWLTVDGQSGVSIPSGMGWRRAAELLREWAEKIERDWQSAPEAS